MKAAILLLPMLLIFFSPEEIPGEGSPDHRKDCREIENQTAPEWDVERWIVPLPEETEGKTILVHFFGLWCTPARESVTALKNLHESWSEKGLLIVSIHTPLEGGKLDDFVREEGIPWPVALDRPAADTPLEASTASRFRADTVPDYFLIDRTGTLRHADIENGAVEKAVRSLLQPPEDSPADPPTDPPPPSEEEDPEAEKEQEDPPSEGPATPPEEDASGKGDR